MTAIRNFGFTFSGGYANSQDVTTYVASRLEGRLSASRRTSIAPARGFPKPTPSSTRFDFRRVKVAASSLQVYPGEISELSTAMRVGGPAFTWIRDTRDSPLDAHRGTYTSFQEFLSDRFFGAEAEFNRIDVSNSSYYGFDKGRFVLARNTRYGQVRAFGSGVKRAASRSPSVSTPAAPFRCADSRRMPPARAILKPASHRRRGRADQQHRTAPAAAHAALAGQHRQLRDLSRHGQCLHQRRRCLGQRFCAFASPTATRAKMRS